MSVAKYVERALRKGFETQLDAWGRRCVVRNPRNAQTWAVEAVWPPQRERADAEAGGFTLQHDATARWDKETGPAPEVGWTVTPDGQGRTFRVVELRETHDVAYAMALQQI